MRREDPGLDEAALATCLATEYGVAAIALAFLPIGYDLNAAVYEVAATDGATYFLKVRKGPVHEPGLRVPHALAALGIRNVIAPLPNRSGRLWTAFPGHDGYTVVLYPFIRGENAMAAGMTGAQWREFGTTLRAVHSSGLANHFRSDLRVEDFSLPSGALVREMLALAQRESFESPAATEFAAFWRANASRIGRLLARARELGRSLQSKRFELVLCHGDIHAANILVGDDGAIWLVDWDTPLIAPRERDLLFVVGAKIARTVTPAEEDEFFAGYAPMAIDPTALAYYRYERIIEDLGEIGKSVFLNPTASEASKQEEAALAISFFAPDGDIDRAEIIHRTRWP